MCRRAGFRWVTLRGDTDFSQTEHLDRWHEDPELQLDALERELFGYDHAAIGSLMAEDWGLPEYLIRAIGGHHEPNGSPEVDPAVRLVSLVTYASERDGREMVSARAESGFEIELPVMEDIMDRSLTEAREVARMFLD